MTKGLFTSTDEIKLQREYMTPVAHPQKAKREKCKPLFTSWEEMRFQKVYVAGHIRQAKGHPMDARQIRQESRRISQNVKRLQQTVQNCIHVR